MKEDPDLIDFSPQNEMDTAEDLIRSQDTVTSLHICKIIVI